MCLFTWFTLRDVNSHWLHLWALKPLCVFIWFLMCFALRDANSQRVHLCHVQFLVGMPQKMKTHTGCICLTFLHFDQSFPDLAPFLAFSVGLDRVLPENFVQPEEKVKVKFAHNLLLISDCTTQNSTWNNMKELKEPQKYCTFSQLLGNYEEYFSSLLSSQKSPLVLSVVRTHSLRPTGPAGQT